MPHNNTVNRRIVLAARPRGAPTQEHFRLEEHPVPEPADGELLLRTRYLSLDPYMRGRMSDAPSYAAPVAVGDVMCGGTVASVVRSRNPGYAEGELVLAYGGWQDYALSDGRGLRKLEPGMARPSLALGVLGMPGFTAYAGLLYIGEPRPGETLVVAAATGAVGSVVAQVAKLKGCRVVGVAGGADKCRHAVETLGLDACVDHRAADFPARLAAAVPEGIDIYYENVGGAVLEAVLPHLNAHARIPVCGLVAHYNAQALPPGPDKLPLLMRAMLVRRVKMQGFIIFNDFGEHYDDFLRDMEAWVRDGRVKYREDVVDGLENAPGAFIGLLEGRNFGKLVVRVDESAPHR